MQPERIGPYRIIRLLGQGGMGAVYEGMNDAIERRVAIKVLHAHLASRKEIATRFINEARATNRIEHPGLVQISDYGQLEDGTAYLTGRGLTRACGLSSSSLSDLEIQTPRLRPLSQLSSKMPAT